MRAHTTRWEGTYARRGPEPLSPLLRPDLDMDHFFGSCRWIKLATGARFFSRVCRDPGRDTEKEPSVVSRAFNVIRVRVDDEHARASSPQRRCLLGWASCVTNELVAAALYTVHSPDACGGCTREVAIHHTLAHHPPEEEFDPPPPPPACPIEATTSQATALMQHFFHADF